MEDMKIKGSKNPKIISNDGEVVLKFYQGKDDLAEPDDFERFIKSCEQMIRKDPRYKNYISELKGMGLIYDVLQSGIDNEKFPNTKIEMHHGPVFTLFDLCSIVTDHLLNEGEKVCVFDIANIILEEHEQHHIMVVMGLTKTNHELVHEGKEFVHIKQTIGDIIPFIKKYKKGIRREHLYTFEMYLDLCKKYDATDNGYLETVKKKIKKQLKKND